MPRSIGRATGRTASRWLTFPRRAKVGQAAFAGAQGLEAEATELEDGGYAWIDVVGVTAEKQKPFEDVKEEVKTAYMDGERRKEVTAIAAKLVERLNGGETLEAVAKEASGKIEKTNPITRNTSPQGLAQNAVQLAFTLSKGAATSALTADSKARIILRVVDIMPAPRPRPSRWSASGPSSIARCRPTSWPSMSAGLQARYGVSVNEGALKQTLGTEREVPDLE